MNTELAALCCGNMPSTHHSGRPVLVCRSCGDQLQGDTAEATIAAWNRAKSPAVTTTEAQRQSERRIAELEGEVRRQLFETREQLRKAENERDGLREELQDAKRFAKNAEVDARDYLKAAESMNKTVVKLMAIVTETQSRADANWHEGERLRGELAAMEAKFNEAHAEGLRVNFLARGKEELAALVGYTEAEHKRGYSLCGIAVEFIEGLQEQLEAAKASGTVHIHHHYASPAVPQ